MVRFGVCVGIESINAVNREAVPPVFQFLVYGGEFLK
jgi:hypothetical protein